MSALSKIRENVGLVIIIIAISLAAFILTDFFTGKTSGNRAGDMVAGEVAGEEISYLEVQRRTELYSRNVQDESISQTYELRRQIWQEIVQEVINFKEWNSVGLDLSDTEERMLYYGPIIHPYVFQYPLFKDSTNQFNPEVVRIRFQQADQINENDPSIDEFSRQFKQDMINLKRAIRINRIAAKWEQMVGASALVSDNEIRRGFVNDQKSVDISYVSVPYAAISNQEVNVTEADYKEYYDKNKESFRRTTESVKIKYTYFPVIPSDADSASARVDISKIIPDFLEAEDPLRFAFSNSDTRKLDSTLKPINELPAALQGINSSDTVVGPILGPEGYKLLRIVKMEQDSIYRVEARHILVQAKSSTPGQAPTEADNEAARQEANGIRAQLAADPSQWAAVAAEKSTDQATRGKGGRIGWIDPLVYGGFGSDFARDVANGSVGSLLVTKSNKGYHVIEVLGRSNKRASFAELNQNIFVSSATSDSIYKRASRFAGQILAGVSMDSTIRDFPEANLNTSQLLGPGSYELLGLEAAREVIAWGFQAESGDISEDILDSDNALVIAQVVERGEPGYASLDEIRDQITPAVITYVKGKLIREKLAGSTGGDLAAIATAYGTGATTSSAAGVRFSSNNVPGLGNEPKVVGRAFGLTQGVVSSPIIGNTGVYVIRVDAITDAPEMVDAIMGFQKQQLQQAKRNQAVNAAAGGMRDIANVKDYRYRFNY